ncbi:MAG: tetratricopeptide repeat protein [Spirochaetia bacterium]|nr:tetratricopeptide repeat protein [Spirochaetia bacterium]
MLIMVALCSCGPTREETAKKFQDANRLYEAHDLEGARKLYGEILDSDYDHTPARIMIARIYYFNRNFEQAHKELENAIDRNPSSIDALFWLARVQSVMPEKKEEALRTLANLLENDGGHIDALLLKASLHEEKKQTHEAIAAYRAVTEREESIARAHARLGMIYGSVGLDSMRKISLTKAALLAPGLIQKTSEAE